MSQRRKGKVGVLHTTLYTNLCYLMCSVPPPVKLKELVSEDMFVHNNSNVNGFHELVHYLLNIWDEAKCKEKFKYCWPVLDQKQKSAFLTSVCSLMQDIKVNHPQAQLPTISKAKLVQPGGDQFCSLMLRLTMFVISHHLSKDSMDILQLPVDKKNTSCTKQLFCSKAQSALENSIKHHAKGVAAISKAEKYGEESVKLASQIVEEKEKASTALGNELQEGNVNENAIARMIDPADIHAMDSWKQEVEVKWNHAEQLLQTLLRDANSVRECRRGVETLTSSTPKYMLDGDELKPPITDELCKQLKSSKEVLTQNLLKSEQLNLHGLVEVGVRALDTLSAQWAQTDMSDTKVSAAKFRALVEQSESQAAALKDKEGELQKICDMLKQTKAKFIQLQNEETASSSISTPLFTRKNKLLPNANLLYQIPCTPPLQLRTGFTATPVQSPLLMKDFKIKTSYDHERVEQLLKLWHEEKLPPLLPPASCVSKSLRPKIKIEPPSSPKRQSSNAEMRASLSQLWQPAAPPPCKDVRLSAARAKPLHSPRFTPSYKQALHQRALQYPSSKHSSRHREQLSPINHVGGWDLHPKVEFSSIDSARKNLSGIHELADSGNLSLTSPGSSQQVDPDTSSDYELPLGELSLQEIAELHLSLDTSITQSPVVHNTAVSPVLPYSSALRATSSPLLAFTPTLPSTTPKPVFPMLSPPAADSLFTPAPFTVPQEPVTDVKPISSLLQRLKAIKSNMKQAPEPSRSKTPELFTPSQHSRVHIKLELESPP